MSCSVKGCDRTATRQAKFVILPSVPPDHPGYNEHAEGLADILACDFHATEQSGREILNDNAEGRQQIEAGFRANGNVPPDWSRSYVEWIPIEYELNTADIMPGSGMSVREAINKARIWWETLGRHELSKQLNKQSNVEEVGRVVKPGTGRSPGFTVAGSREVVVPSGILQGLPWDQLTKQEQTNVVRQWHHFHVVHPLQGMAGSQRQQ